MEELAMQMAALVLHGLTAACVNTTHAPIHVFMEEFVSTDRQISAIALKLQVGPEQLARSLFAILLVPLTLHVNGPICVRTAPV